MPSAARAGCNSSAADARSRAELPDLDPHLDTICAVDSGVGGSSGKHCVKALLTAYVERVTGSATESRCVQVHHLYRVDKGCVAE